jgi:hypothetical protein
MRFGRFFFFTSLQFGITLLLFRLAAPNVLAQELRHPGAIVGLIVLYGLPLSLFEYLYHRYLLHSAILPFMKSMHSAHTLHHSLTSVKAPVRGDAPEELVPVKSDYPVEHEHQTEAMEFPPYALSIFLGIFLILFALPVKLLFPGTPAIFGLICSVTLFYSSYELWHAVLHLPYDQYWKPAMEMRGLGRVVKRTYAFHLMHHWRPTANLAIVGFWGVALWDYALHTHRRPQRLPLKGAFVTYRDSVLKSPYWPIATMDRWKGGWYRWSRNVEDWSAAVFLRRPRPAARQPRPEADPVLVEK